MKIIKSIEDLKNFRREVLTKEVGFIPTMGALHSGHISLIERAKLECDIVIVSIFVNPTQFLKGEDFSKYPRRVEADIKSCNLAKVDALFMPDESMMYRFEDELSLKAPKLKSYILEGFSRASHFDGVLQIVLKLFNLVKPDRAYFGRKDAQQLILIKNMIESLFLDIEIVDCPTVRESDGLALSSRNIYLSDSERELALLISKSLKEASALIVKGVLDIEIIKERMKKTLKPLDIDYIEIVDRELNPLSKVEIKNSLILVAVKIGEVRYIDNFWV